MKCEVRFFQKSRLKTYLENGRILLRRVNCCLHPTGGFKVMLQSLFQPDDGNGDDDEDDDDGDDDADDDDDEDDNDDDHDHDDDEDDDGLCLGLCLPQDV